MDIFKKSYSWLGGQCKKAIGYSAALVLSIGLVGGTVVNVANAALVQTDVDAIKTEVLADLAIAIAAGFSIFAVSIAAKVGFSMLSRFINKGARG